MTIRVPRIRGAVLAAVVALIATVGLAGPFAASPSWAAPTSPVEVTGMTVEHRHGSPLGIDAAHPRLGWQMSAHRRGQHQRAYQVLVATSPDRLTPSTADMWNSGKVESSDSVAVRYEGERLRPSTKYFWSVRVWGMNGKPSDWSKPASFETSLLSTDGVTNWDGATWISMAGKDPASPGAPMLRAEVPLEGDDVRSARLYASALGVYDAYINGQRVASSTAIRCATNCWRRGGPITTAW